MREISAPNLGEADILHRIARDTALIRLSEVHLARSAPTSSTALSTRATRQYGAAQFKFCW
jgi:hypothetical protein